MKPLSAYSQPLPLDIVGSSTFGRFPKILSSRTFNMIISDNALISHAGYKKVATIAIGGQEGREIFKSTKFNHLVAVIDNGFYIIDTNLGISKIGNLSTSTGNVFITENDANQIAIVDGENVYIFNYVTNAFNTATIDFLPGYITFQDGYFIASDTRTNQWRLSAPNDGLSWPDDAPNVGLLESKPDMSVAVVTLGRQLFVFGKIGAEPWYDVGYQLFPYVRSNYYSIDYGCLSAATIAARFGIMVWLAANEASGPTIMVSTGGEPQELSTDGINYQLARLTAPEDSYGFLAKIAGHIIYQLTFRTDNWTIAYDFNTKKFFDFTDHELNYHIARRIAFFNNAYYFVSFSDGNLYQLDPDFTTYDGAIIPRIRVCSNIRQPDGSLFIVSNTNLTFEEGESTDAPRIDLAISRDGGVSFGSYAPYPLNMLGNRIGKVDFWNLGAANDFVPQFRLWSDGRFVATSGTMSIYQ